MHCCLYTCIAESYTLNITCTFIVHIGTCDLNFSFSLRATPDPVQITAYARIKEATPDVDPVCRSVVTSDAHWL